MLNNKMVAVTSRSFSKNLNLRARLCSKFNNVKFNDSGESLFGSKLMDFLSNANFAIIGLETIDDCLLENLPNLRGICKMGTGVDKIDFLALKKRNILFSATPGLNKRSVSELVLGLVISIKRHLLSVQKAVKRGVWKQPLGSLLSENVVGIIGYGAIGQDLARLLSVFDCQCLIYDVRNHANLMAHVQQVDLKTLLSESDLISLHIPLLPENYHFLGINEMKMMKSESILINTARGGLVDEDALFYMLKNKFISAAAFDVFEFEPVDASGLLSLDNFFATSHIGGSSIEAIEAMGIQAIDYLYKLESI